jgi:hypothetical protein
MPYHRYTSQHCKRLPRVPVMARMLNDSMKLCLLLLLCVALSGCSPCPPAAEFDANATLQRLWNESLTTSPRIVNWPGKARLQRDIFGNTNHIVHVVKARDVVAVVERILEVKGSERFILYGTPSELRKHKCLVEVCAGGHLGLGWAADFDLKGNLILLWIMPEG